MSKYLAPDLDTSLLDIELETEACGRPAAHVNILSLRSSAHHDVVVVL